MTLTFEHDLDEPVCHIFSSKIVVRADSTHTVPNSLSEPLKLVGKI